MEQHETASGPFTAPWRGETCMVLARSRRFATSPAVFLSRSVPVGAGRRPVVDSHQQHPDQLFRMGPVGLGLVDRPVGKEAKVWGLGGHGNPLCCRPKPGK
jgi:hypothetical protein